jgi:uncharacterized membrane protein
VRRIRESLFFIPTAALLLFVLLAALSIWVDSAFTDTFEDFPLVLSATVSGGRAIATTVAGATITVAAIVFSITALSTQMTASQYSPRSVGGFFDDPFQQAIIGLIVGTFTYSLLILAGLGDVIDDPNGATPSLSVSLTILFGVLSAIGIVAYINHSLRRMQIDSVVRRIAGAALKSVRRELEEPEGAEVPEASPPQGTQSEVLAKRTGWVTSIDTRSLLPALPPSTTARIDVRVGEAVSEGDRIATLWFREEQNDEEDKRLVAMTVRDAVGLASQRSIATDPTFGIRQLIDIALRALSPGVNDPTTAVDVLHHLKIPIREVLVSDAPRRVFTGPENQRVYLSETPSRTDYVHMAFAEIRLAAGNQLSVIDALVEVLEDLESELEVAGLSGRAEAVEAELRLTSDMARRSGLPEADLERVIGRELEEAVENGTPEGNHQTSIG